MKYHVTRALEDARTCFEIDDFPGNFFTLLGKLDYTEKYGLLLFKEDIDKLSGFIGYGDGGLSIICINYQRPIGHQNFTIAHELGHWFMHKGQNISDDEMSLYSATEAIEKEANNFAEELLYPKKLFDKDYSDIMKNGLLQANARKELAICIDKLCHKYCLSFDMVLSKVLYKNYQILDKNHVKKEIKDALGCKISDYFEKDFYVPNETLPEYQQLRIPYMDLEKRIDMAEKSGKIGRATAESIKYRNRIPIK